MGVVDPLDPEIVGMGRDVVRHGLQVAVQLQRPPDAGILEEGEVFVAREPDSGPEGLQDGPGGGVQTVGIEARGPTLTCRTGKWG